MGENFSDFNPENTPETHQEKEQMMSLLREACDQQKIIDLVMDNFGKEQLVQDILVLSVDGTELVLSYIAEDGDLGESIPVSLDQIKHVTVVDDWVPPESEVE